MIIGTGLFGNMIANLFNIWVYETLGFGSIFIINGCIEIVCCTFLHFSIARSIKGQSYDEFKDEKPHESTDEEVSLYSIPNIASTIVFTVLMASISFYYFEENSSYMVYTLGYTSYQASLVPIFNFVGMIFVTKIREMIKIDRIWKEIVFVLILTLMANSLFGIATFFINFHYIHLIYLGSFLMAIPHAYAAILSIFWYKAIIGTKVDASSE